jgi:hypothetical protein
MLDWVAERPRDRKLRLFACACCRRVAPLLSSPDVAGALDVAEWFADGRTTADECRAASRRANDRYNRAPKGRANGTDVAVAWAAAVAEAGSFPAHYAAYAFQNACRLGGPWVDGQPLTEPQRRERASQAALVRDIFGNPFRPVSFSPQWSTGTAVSLAEQMSEARDFSAMPILADALQDAGCDDADILDHCRGPGSHVRGCWVVDLVLGKE